MTVCSANRVTSLHNLLPVQDTFPVLLPVLSAATKDKELGEFRSLLQTVFSCLKSVLYCMVAFHTNRGLQAPVRFALVDVCGSGLATWPFFQLAGNLDG